jgi:uncharacterized protein (DUF2345 family)
MQLNATQLAALLKFNSGKNGKTLSKESDDKSLQPGSHPVSITVTLDGYVDRSPDREQTRTTFPAASKAFAIAEDQGAATTAEDDAQGITLQVRK